MQPLLTVCLRFQIVFYLLFFLWPFAFPAMAAEITHAKTKNPSDVRFSPLIVLAQAESSTKSPPKTQYEKSVEALKAGDPVAALNAIQQAIFESPANLEYQYMLGNVYFHLGRYTEAENIYLALIRKDAIHFQKCTFDLSAVYLRTKEFEKSLNMLKTARPLDDGRADYETGIIFMHMKKPEMAIAFFETAAQKKPEIAFQAGIQQATALRELNETQKAKQILNTLLRMELNPEQQDEAYALLESIETTPEPEKPWYLSASAGVQYDDNVFQDALDQVISSPSPGTVRDKEDVAGMATLYGRYDLWKMDGWKAGLSYFHYQLMYRNLTENNLIGARPSAYLQWNRNPYMASLEYAYNRYWVDEEPRVDVHALLPRVFILHGNQFQSEIYGGVEGRFYKDTTPDDRHYFLGLNEYWFFNGGKAHLRAGYMADYDNYIPDIRGDSRFHQFQVAINWPFWENRVRADICGIYLYRHMDFDPNLDADEKRRDNEFHVNVQLYGDIISNFSYNLGYFQTVNDANVTNDLGIDPYHFQRAVYSFSLIYSF
ncbi:MAG: tetratricopeptide repeat protein [Desulfatirhabdiaceae bacterium]